MGPLRKAPPESSPTRPSSALLDGSRQYGRSSTSLNAEVAALSLSRDRQKSQSQDTLQPLNTLPLSHAKSTPALTSASSQTPATTGLSVNRRSSYVPVVSSPLNPKSSGSISSASSLERRLSDENGSTSSSPPRGSALHREAVTKRMSLPLASTSAGQNGREQRDMSEIGAMYKTGAPMSIQDLGSDYTRYFNPFSDSRRSSFVESGGISTPLPQYNNHSSLNLAATSQPLLGDKLQANTSTTRLLNENGGTDPAFFPFLDDRLAAPFSEKEGFKFPLYVDEKEDDDDMHMPMPDDDIRYKPNFRDHFSGGNLASTVGMMFMALGLLFVFVAIPVLSFTGFISYGAPETPLDQMYHLPQAESWAIVNNLTYPLLSNVRKGLIDPDTPASAMTRTDINGNELELVFSDEFNDNNRTFYPGDDPFWSAPDIWYGATGDLDWYDPDAVTTFNGVLELRLDKFPNHDLSYRSGMLNSWNQLCFKGGVFEVSVSLPGPAGVQAFWPGAWTMGNLGRPGYLATTEGMWPYTYNECDAGITPNQSMADGTSRLPGQRLNSCTCPGDDHPNPGTGRGAPEIDIFEAGANGRGLGIVTQSYQVAPFDIWYYPDYDFTAYPDYTISWPNGYTGGPFQQAVSATTNLNNDWYDGNQYQKYAFEYVPGTGSDAYIAWFVGNEMTWMMNGNAIGPNGNIGARQVSEEPMSIILNLGFSQSWTFIDYQAIADAFPAVMRVDYVRWYQPKGQTMVTCDPPGYETTKYIQDHLNAYSNPNLTKWSETGHPWPSNKLTTDC